MASDPLANMVERLRGRGCQPRKVGRDLWESKCPGHGSADHALAVAQGADGKLEVTCRSIESCSLSRIVKKLDLKLDRLFTETQPALIRRLRELEIQPSIYQPPDAVVPVIVDSTGTESANEPGAVGWSGTNRAVDLATLENGELPSGASPTTAYTHAPCESDSSDGSREVVLSLEKLTHGAPAAAAGAGEGNATARGETRVTGGVEELLKIAGRARTFRRPDGGYSLSRSVDGHAECHELDSPDVRRWLTRAYFESTGRLPSSSAIASALFALTAHADMNRSHDSDFVRVGRSQSGSSYFLDLGDPTWRAVEIKATGWQIVPRPDVHFRRSQGQLAFPTPARDGSLALLKNYVNVDSDDLPLLIAWITAALRPIGPHPILVITGEQGAAKSTLARVCRLLTDPHTAPLRRAEGPPRPYGRRLERLGSGL